MRIMRECASCGRTLPKASFGKNQYKRGAGLSRCSDCVDAERFGSQPQLRHENLPLQGLEARVGPIWAPVVLLTHDHQGIVQAAINGQLECGQWLDFGGQITTPLMMAAQYRLLGAQPHLNISFSHKTVEVQPPFDTALLL